MKSKSYVEMSSVKVKKLADDCIASIEDEKLKRYNKIEREIENEVALKRIKYQKKANSFFGKLLKYQVPSDQCIKDEVLNCSAASFMNE